MFGPPHRHGTRLAKRRAKAAITLQRFSRTALRRARRLAEIDPITLAAVEPPLFLHVDADTGQETCFGAVILAQYITESGDFRNPRTRAELTRADLLRLQRASGHPVFAEMERSEARRKARQEREDLLQWLESEAVEQSDAVVAFLRRGRGSLFRLSAHLLPMLAGAVERVRALDPSRAQDLCGRAGRAIEGVSGEGRGALREICAQHVRSMSGRVAAGRCLDEIGPLPPLPPPENLFALLLDRTQ